MLPIFSRERCVQQQIYFLWKFIRSKKVISEAYFSDDVFLKTMSIPM
jgi:hypothetical protein